MQGRNYYDHIYRATLSDIIQTGDKRESAREGMPNTIDLFCKSFYIDLEHDRFPLLTLKKINFNNIKTELLWFLKGLTNIQYLIHRGCNIWNDDAYKYYKRLPKNEGSEDLSKEEFLALIEIGHLDKHNVWGNNYQLGDLGNIYGKQWRNWNSEHDQIINLIHNLRTQPTSRYHVVTAWNPSDFVSNNHNAALPACHMMFQCFTRKTDKGVYLDLMMNQRSCDYFLGVPYNIASYSLLLHILADLTGIKPGKFYWVGNCIHLYENHLEQAHELLSRMPNESPSLYFTESYYKLRDLLTYNHITMDDFINALDEDMFQLKDYNPHPPIKAPLSVGV